MSSSGPNSPGSVVNVDDTGNVAWTAPGEAASSNDTYARAIDVQGGRNSQLLIASNFGFAIPAGATINGIEVQIERKSAQASTGVVVDETISLTLDGAAPTGDNKATAEQWAAADRTDSYGSPEDVWGIGPSPEQVNDSNFGVIVKAQNTGDADDSAYVDHIKVTITYTAASNRNSGINRLMTGVG